MPGFSNDEKKVRLFIAFELPLVNDDDEPIQYVNTQLLVAQSIPDFRPIRLLHATIIFIGAVPESKIALIKKAIERAVRLFVERDLHGATNGLPGFMIEPGAVVLGQNAVAMHLISNVDLSGLYKALHVMLAEQKISHDTNPHTMLLHVTIGRIKASIKHHAQVTRFLRSLPAPLGGDKQNKATFTVRKLVLYQSVPNEPYKALTTWNL